MTKKAWYFHAFKNLANHLGQKPSWGLIRRQENHFCYSQPTSQPWVGRKIFLLNPPDANWRQSFSGIRNVSAGKENRCTVCHRAEYLQSQGPRDQPKACLHSAASPMRVSGQNLTCVPGNLGANLNTKDCACLFSEILKEEHLLAKPRNVGQKETTL